MSFEMLAVFAMLALIAVLLAVLLLRSPRPELPPEWAMRLQRLEQVAQATQLAVAKNDGALDGMAQQLRGFTHATQSHFEAQRGAVDERLAQAVHDARAGRAELREGFDAFEAKLAQRLAQAQADAAVARRELNEALGAFRAELAQTSETLRGTLHERLSAIQADNAARLEEMRRTVDEKLHATLEQRLGESFKLVSDRLEQVHRGLGEMQTLAGSVGDLKRVMTNVKTRGTWGELQLGAIIDNVLAPDQYARNVKTVPGSDELVEFAIRLPGRGQEEPVWLPIDAKFPVESYQRLLDAHDAADKLAVQAAGNALEAAIRLEARKISSKYVSPPHTTDFAVLYLPTEGLFAEVIRRPGLVEALQGECRVMVTGPANLAAMLSSLQMGFKTLAIEKRSSEVWGLLGAVKTEFAKFGDVVEATRKSIDAAAKRFDEVGVRTRAIQRRLRDVQDLPAPQAAAAPALGAAGAASEEEAA
ncbi:DNA recombination protein RmuC [Acidovorax sp. GBBC 3334]|uniref:DNA recombination protein RmuC n=1 Tax=Acidovorax sp. GBBC 3334 TaxID=2940496 RepID=UPI00230355D6|nr:DNA recombination protein RmuC [Acidovorax sp. GBBC 3334]MDA8453158.1 DNA recombination protein RmuC [Acidovorax sp. GBBC 3334]